MFWLAAWVIKFAFLIPLFFVAAFRFPVIHPLFPAFLRDPWVSSIAYVLPFSAVLAFLWPRKTILRATASILVLSSATLCVHINTYNDATFVTCFWAGLWILWLSVRLGRSDRENHLHGAFLAQCVISLIFLGGLLGKLTPEWWRGEVLYQYYFLQKPNFPYPWLRETFSDEGIQAMAMWFSRAAIAGELFLAASFLLPGRFVLVIQIWMMMGIVVVSTWYLFSVMGPLVGLAFAARHLAEAPERHPLGLGPGQAPGQVIG